MNIEKNQISAAGGFDVSKIFKDYSGRVCAVIGVKRIWEEVFDASKLKGPESVDRNLILSEIGPESLRPGVNSPIHPAHPPTNFLVMTSSGMPAPAGPAQAD